MTLYISAGPSVSYVDVPNLAGMTVEEALSVLQRNELICTDSEITYVSSSAAEAGKVLWQSPSAGESTIAGARVYIQVGKNADAG